MSKNNREQKINEVIKYDRLDSEKKELSNRALIGIQNVKKGEVEYSNKDSSNFYTSKGESGTSGEINSSSSNKKEKDFYSFYINDNQQNKEQYHFKNIKSIQLNITLLLFFQKVYYINLCV